MKSSTNVGRTGLVFEMAGEAHTMSPEELEAIERSGPPHSWREYAGGHHGRGYWQPRPGHITGSILQMCLRPGRTEPGILPVDPPPLPAPTRGQPMFVRSGDRALHWIIKRADRRGVYRACDPNRAFAKPCDGLFMKRFSAAIWIPRLCPICVEMFKLRD
jgi:hypothetical protein